MEIFIKRLHSTRIEIKHEPYVYIDLILDMNMIHENDTNHDDNTVHKERVDNNRLLQNNIKYYTILYIDTLYLVYALVLLIRETPRKFHENLCLRHERFVHVQFTSL